MKTVLALFLALTTTVAHAAYEQTPYPVSKGGSGAASFTAGSILLGNGTSAFSLLGGTDNNVVLGHTGAAPTMGQITNAYVDAAAAIAYSKLNLSASIVNADIASGAAIAFSKLAALTSTNILVGNGSNVAAAVAVSGDATLANTGALTLATVNSNVGSFTNANITVNAKGLITAAANGTTANPTVTNGGNTAYTILTTDGAVRTGTTLTADRAYTLPACTAGNIGEIHRIKNLPAQTKNIILTAAGSDNIDGNATFTINPGDNIPVICAAFSGSGTWDIE